METIRHRARRSLGAALLLGLGLIGPSAAEDRTVAARRAWLFFDLGNTLVQTWPDPDSQDVDRACWIRFRTAGGRVVTAHEHLFDLGARGYRLGLIANMPPAWGDPLLSGAREWVQATDMRTRRLRADGLTRAKMSALVGYLAGRGPSDPAGGTGRWKDRVGPALIHQLFPDPVCLVPFLAAHRKPDRGPPPDQESLFLFREAAARAARAGLIPVYLGENAHETAAARQAGLIAHQVRFEPEAAVQGTDFLPSEAQLEALIGSRP